jgi:hypothetical protein
MCSTAATAGGSVVEENSPIYDDKTLRDMSSSPPTSNHSASFPPVSQFFTGDHFM